MDVSRRQQIRDTNPAIGQRIRDGRSLRRLSQENLAASLGVTFQQVQKYESGTNRVSVSTLLAIAEALDLEPGFFLPPGAAPIGPNEIEIIHHEIADCLAMVDASLANLTAMRERLQRAASRIVVPAAPTAPQEHETA